MKKLAVLIGMTLSFAGFASETESTQVAGCVSTVSIPHDVLSIDIAKTSSGTYECTVYTYAGWSDVRHYQKKCDFSYNEKSKSFVISAGNKLSGSIKTKTADVQLSTNGYSNDTHFYPATIRTGIKTIMGGGKETSNDDFVPFACYFLDKP
jgi:hypothetical protein